MGFLDRLFSKPKPESPSDAEPTTPVNQQRPFDVIFQAEEAWKEGEDERAEALFQHGIEAYRSREPSGLDFALGRYGAFLLQKARLDEAATVLEEAIRLGTDIPAIWNDYLEIPARRRDLPGLF